MQKTWGKMFVLPLSKIFPIIFRIPQESSYHPAFIFPIHFWYNRKNWAFTKKTKPIQMTRVGSSCQRLKRFMPHEAIFLKIKCANTFHLAIFCNHVTDGLLGSQIKQKVFENNPDPWFVHRHLFIVIKNYSSFSQNQWRNKFSVSTNCHFLGRTNLDYSMSEKHFST